MSPRPDVSEKRRAQIVESAINVFNREGFANARMDDVAAESGLSKGLLYWYFKNKEELIIAIADLLFGAEFRKMESLSVKGGTARDCLEEFLKLFLSDIRGMLKVAPVIYDFYALAFRNASIRRVMKEYLGRFIAVLEPIIQQGMDSGEFTGGDARQVTIAIGAALEGTLLLWAYAPDLFQVEEQLSASMRLVIKGLEATN
jgi:AcrR family transcriptional regulator